MGYGVWNMEYGVCEMDYGWSDGIVECWSGGMME